MIYKIFYFTCLLFLLLSCDKSTEPNSKLFKITGIISNKNGPISNASVSINNKLNWTAKTSASGEFTINNVSEGDHNISILKNEANDSFIEFEKEIAVHSDLNLDLIKLPIPVKINEPYNISVSDISLSWNSTDAEDFREYKLYRHDSAGLDETTGELIFVSTERADTSFIDIGLISNKTYFYRVYLMNEYGRIGGSNIVNSTTKIGNLIPDGGFEDTNGLSQYWNITWGEATFIYNDSFKISENYSLYGQIPVWVTLTGNTTISLSKDVTYELSGWFKAKGHFTATEERIRFRVFNQSQSFGKEIQIWAPLGVDSVDMDWTFKTNTFTPTKDVIVNFDLTSGFENIWVDNLSLKAK